MYRRAGVRLGLVLLAAFVAVVQAVAAEPLRVRVHGGVLVGTVESGVAVFKGIPYAKTPVGALRWALPQPASRWKGEWAANDFGASCMQPEPPHGGSSG
jgi:para-nitrobenzyl esterase